MSMAEARREFDDPSRRQSDFVRNLLRRIPLALRMAVYGVVFLSAVLLALPWAAYRLDVYAPSCHVEIGWPRILGWLVFAACLVTYVWSSYLLSRRGRGAYVEFDPPTQFVADGPYRRVRNPVAACVLGMLLGEAVALSSTGVFLLFLLAILIAHLQVVLVEEPLLRRRFGPSYEDYLSRVPRWIPRLLRRETR